MLAELNKEREAMKGVQPASDEEVQDLAYRLHTSMVDNKHGHWFHLFKHMDTDNSGQVTFSELQDLVRGELEMDAAELPEATLKSLWVSLDNDRSGYITAKEFGHFMKRGAPQAVKTTNLEKRRQLGMQMRASLEQEKAERMEAEMQKAVAKAQSFETEKASLEQELQALTSLKQVGDAQLFVGRLKGMRTRAQERGAVS